MYKILVPLDGSTQGRRALPWADVLADGLGAEVWLVRSVDWPGPETFDQSASGEGLSRSLAHVEDELAAAAKKFRLAAPKVEVIRGNSMALATKARTEDFDLVVMATHGRTGVDRALVGSVTGEMIAVSGLPVMSIGPMVPEGSARVPKTILMAFDGSPLSRSILRPLVPMATRLRSRMIVFQALEAVGTLALQGALIPLETPWSGAPEHSMDQIDGVVQELRREGLEADAMLEFGAAADLIIERCRSERADIIALTTHSRRGPARWLIGSVAEQVIADATVPVLAYHPLEDWDALELEALLT